MKDQECATTKTCSNCNEQKELTEFHKRLDKFVPKCKVCVAEYTKAYRENNRKLINDNAAVYRENNREVLAQRSRDWYETADKKSVSERMKQYRADNKEQVNAAQLAWNSKNQDKKRGYGRKTYRNNPESYARNTAVRRRMQKQAIPAWYDAVAVNDIYKEAATLSAKNGQVYHVDHIVPINHPLVCGLHVQNNLQVLTAKDNLAKSNKLVDDIVCSQPRG